MNTTPSGSRRTKRVKFSLAPDGHVAERLRRDGDHVARAFERAAHFAGRVTRGPAHLPGELLGDLRRRAFRTRRRTASRIAARSASGGVAPRRERMARGAQRLVDLLRSGERTLDVDASVDGADGFLEVRAGSSDDLEVTRQFPVRDRAAELAVFPFAAGGEVLDERVAEQRAAGLGFLQPLGRLGQRAWQASGSSETSCRRRCLRPSGPARSCSRCRTGRSRWRRRARGRD